MDSRGGSKAFGMDRVNFFDYIRANIRWISIVCLFGILMTVLLLLNNVPSHEILYGICLCAILFAVVLGAGYYACRRRCRRLAELGAAVDISLRGLPDCIDQAECRYQELLRALFVKKQQLEQRMLSHEKEQTEYYTMWVHQIKTPIAALKLLLEEEKGGEGRRAEELAELFRIEQYVEMALSYTRLESESSDFVFRRVELDDVIREAVRKYAKQFIRKKISLCYEPIGQRVLTDEKWLNFVLGQLLSNALKYTQKGSISIFMEKDCLVLRDTGIGIRAEDLPRVCEMGYTGYNGHADSRSTGIGLYLCSRILKKLGHGFSITSQEGNGTCVMIRFEEKELEE